MKCNKGFALIGCGMIARVHAQAIEHIDGAKIVAVYDNFYQAAEKFATEHNCKAYKTVEELLADKDVEIVNICTPSGLHAELAIKAANAKKHIIVEKPMAITEEQVEAVIKAVEDNGVKVEVVTQLRFTEAVQKIKKAIDEGRLGKILLADYRMKYYRSPEYYAQGGWRGTWKMDGGGAMMNQGIHGIDLIQYLVGGVKSVNAVCKTMSRDIETEDTANVLVEYNCGAIGIIQCTTVAEPGYPRSIEITGTNGTIVLREDAIESWGIKGETEQTGEMLTNAFADPSAVSYNFHKMQFEDLIDAVEKDRRPLVDIYEGRKPVDIILASYKSSNEGKKIEIK